MTAALKNAITASLFLLLAGCTILIISGVLMSPGDAVHGRNHDYHVLLQQRGKGCAGGSTAFQRAPAPLIAWPPAQGGLLIEHGHPESPGPRAPSVQSSIRAVRLLL